MQKTKHRFGHHLIAVGVFAWIALSVAVNFTPGIAYAVSTNDVFSLSNQQRVNNGLAGFTSNSKLNASAQNKAQHMLSNGYFAHTAPDGTTPWSFISGAGYSYSAAAENLASSNQGANSIVQGWMNSSGHRANLLSTTYKEVGYGVVYVGDWQYNGVTYSNTYFVVAHYGLATGASSAPANTTPAPESQPEQAPSRPVANPTPAPTSQNAEPEIPAEVIEEPEEVQEVVEEAPSENQDTLPLASVVQTKDNLIGPRLALALATLALGAIIAGIVLEVRWIKHHSHVGLHLPHLHI